MSYSDEADRKSTRLDDLGRFYRLLQDLEQRVGGKRSMRDFTEKLEWPGMYFFFDPHEHRHQKPELRVVRVGISVDMGKVG